ncbi:MAG TPA: hypothetical protein VM577_14400 [Anaerovoracaceae bacterium]|nr:hypothetical protein [Anaerovoracaceae bacterium]
MKENLADALLKAGSALHWFGQYDVANACILLSRLVRARNITDLDEFETFVKEQENHNG